MSWRGRIALGGAAVVLAAALVVNQTSEAAQAGFERAGQQDYWIEQIADGLDFPSSMAWLPDGRLLVLERMAGIRIVQDGKLLPQSIEGVPPSFQSDQSDGLRDIAIDPDFANNQLIYLLLSEGNFDGRGAAVYRGRLVGDKLTDVARIFRTRDSIAVPANTSMPTRLRFFPDGTLLVGVAGIEAKDVSQRLDSHAGKILRINRDGSVPKDNPFVGRSDALPELWSYGHRVVLGECRFSDDAKIWAVEPMDRGGDELNVVKKGANYGWSKVSWSFSYENSGAQSAHQTEEGIEDPKLIWMPSVTPSGLACYEGSAFPAWKHDLFVSELTGRALERIRLDDRYRPIERQLFATELDERIRDVEVGPDGFIYFLTDSGNGRLLRLRPGAPTQAERKNVAVKRGPTFVRAPSKIALGDPAKGKEIFTRRCLSCHSFGKEMPGGHIGPDLGGLMGRLVASVPGFGYSTALKGKKSIGMVWHLTTLEMLLSDPSGFAPGTTMTVALDNREERRAVIAFLKKASEEGVK